MPLTRARRERGWEGELCKAPWQLGLPLWSASLTDFSSQVCCVSKMWIHPCRLPEKRGRAPGRQIRPRDLLARMTEREGACGRPAVFPACQAGPRPLLTLTMHGEHCPPNAWATSLPKPTAMTSICLQRSPATASTDFHRLRGAPRSIALHGKCPIRLAALEFRRATTNTRRAGSCSNLPVALIAGSCFTISCRRRFPSLDHEPKQNLAQRM